MSYDEALEEFLNSIDESSSLERVAEGMIYDKCDYFLWLFWDALERRILKSAGDPSDVDIFHTGPAHESKWQLKETAGVYVAYDDPPRFGFVYIGQSGDIGRRIMGRSRAYGFPLIILKIADTQRRRTIEKKLIKALNPERNVHHVGQ